MCGHTNPRDELLYLFIEGLIAVVCAVVYNFVGAH
ncbi:MAG: hypothetical protein QOE33_1794 [Acidobacteriota bacterium]|nr:hypothetical protein [Acidobacteriota bacterium]